MRKLKIAVTAGANIPSMWAHGINTVKHAQGFLDLGCEVELLIVKRLNELMFELKTFGIHRFYGISPEVNIKRFYERPLSFFSKTVFLSAIIPSLIKIFPIERYLQSPEEKIVKYLKKNEFDLLYSRSYAVAYYGIKYGIPTILETHATQLKRKFLQEVSKYSQLKIFRGIVTIHPLIKKKHIKEGVPENKIVVLEDAVDIKKFDEIKLSKNSLRKKLYIPRDKFIILYAGSLKAGKGIGEIIKVSKKLHDSFLFYLVGGDRTEVSKWKKKVKKLGLNNVILTGFMPPPMIPLYLKSADVLIMLFNPKEKNKIMDLETTSPIKIFEYMASKKPIISTQIPTIEKIITSGKEGLLSPPEDYEQTVEYLISLKENSHLRENLAKNAYEKALEFTYKKRCEKIINTLFY